jgi:hypothetical protein
MPDTEFIPDWNDTPPLPGSYGSIVKEGRPDQIRVPSRKY